MLALAGVDSFVLVGRKRDRGTTRSSSVVVRSKERNQGKERKGKEKISGGSQMDLIELTVCQPSFSQTCKTSSENHLVLFLTHFLSIWKVWCHQDEQANE